MSCGISVRFQTLSPSLRQVTHALLTRPPLSYPKASFQITPFDLHVLGAPPAFVLSQDQTLNLFVSYHGLPCYNLRLRSPSLDSLLSYFLVELNRVRFISSRYFLTLFNFQDPFAALSDNPLSRIDSIIISLCRPFVKHFFRIFFEALSSSLPFVPVLRDSFVIIPRSFPFVNPFFPIF